MALKVGVGAMDGGRWVDLVKTGYRRGYYTYNPRMLEDYGPLSRMYTLDFVNQNAGMEFKKRLLGD